MFPLYFLGYVVVLILSALLSSLASTLSSYLYSSKYKLLQRPTHRSPDTVLSEQPLPSKNEEVRFSVLVLKEPKTIEKQD